MRISDFSRRSFVATSVTALAMTLAPTGALALSEAKARALVDKVVIDVNKVIASGKSLNRMIADFEKIFSKYADVNIIAASALGPDARRLSASQRRAYTNAFQGYIARKYGKRFNEFVGGVVEVTGARQVKSFIEVKTVAKLQGKSPFQVDFLVSDKSGSHKFFDMIIEGISLRLSEKSEIGAMLDKRGGDLNGLIDELKRAG